MQGQDLPLSFEMIIAGDEMFANLPGAGWMRLDTSFLSEILGQAGPGIDDPFGTFDSLFPSGDLPLHLYNV